MEIKEEKTIVKKRRANILTLNVRDRKKKKEKLQST